MFYKKNRRRVGISLAAVSMLLSIWGITSILQAQVSSSDFDVAGGLTMSGCKDPCDDTWITGLTECQHLTGSTCETDACMLNSLRYLKCDCGSAGPGEDDCEYYLDDTDWQRWEIHRTMTCNSTTPYTLLYGTCAKSGIYDGANTPCVYNECFGEILRDHATAWSRARCGTAP